MVEEVDRKKQKNIIGSPSNNKLYVNDKKPFSKLYGENVFYIPLCYYIEYNVDDLLDYYFYVLIKTRERLCEEENIVYLFKVLRIMRKNVHFN